MTTQPTEQTGTDRATSDPTTLVPTPTSGTGHVTAREIRDLLRHLGELRVGAPGNDPAERAAFGARKAALLARIADPHTDRGTGPASSAPERHTP